MCFKLIDSKRKRETQPLYFDHTFHRIRDFVGGQMTFQANRMFAVRENIVTNFRTVRVRAKRKPSILVIRFTVFEIFLLDK